MADIRTESAGEWLRTALILAAAIGLAQASANVALAHKGKLPTDALSLVRQAAALLAQDPKMTAEVKERLDAALTSRDPRGVNLANVEQARSALASGDILATRRLLADAIVPVSAGTPAPSMPPSTSTTAGTIPMPPAASPPGSAEAVRPATAEQMATMKMAEPLVSRYTGTLGESTTVLVGLVLVVAGLVMLRRGR